MLNVLLVFVIALYICAWFLFVLELFNDAPLFIHTKKQLLLWLFVPGYFILLTDPNWFNTAKTNLRNWFSK
jgi:hypothetical protein